jgi:hypothetical protein
MARSGGGGKACMDLDLSPMLDLKVERKTIEVVNSGISELPQNIPDKVKLQTNEN